MFEKRKIKEQLQKENICDIQSSNKFMDKIADKLSDYDLKRAYIGAETKYKKKPNRSTLYIMEYFKNKCEKRRIIL